MTRLIYQVAVGPQKPLWVKCRASVEAYAAAHDIDYHCQTEPILKIRPQNSQRSREAVERLGYLPIYEKQNALALLDVYDQVATIDSDVFVRDPSLPIFIDVPPDVDCAGVTERSLPMTKQYRRKLDGYEPAQYNRLNGVGLPFLQMGVFVMNRSLRRLIPESPRAFLARPELQRFIDGEGAWRWQTEQTLFNWFLRSSGARIREMHWHWNALYGAIPVERCNEARFVHFFLSDHLQGDDPREMLRTGTARPRV